MDSKKHRVVFHPEIPQERVDEARKALFPDLNLDVYAPDARDTVKFTFDNIARKALHYRDVDPDFGKPTYVDMRGKPLIDTLVETGLAQSRRDARRLCEQGGIRVNGERISTLDLELAGDVQLRVGKKKRAYVTL